MNPEQRKQIIILIIFVIGLIGALIYMFTSMPGGGGGTTSTTQTVARAATPTKINQPKFQGDLDRLLEGIAEVTFDYRAAAGDRPSPMKPKITTWDPIKGEDGGGNMRNYDVQRLRVSGIIWDETNPYAVVEGEVVWNGYDYGNGLKVHSIEKDRVFFDLDGFRIPVEMEEL